ncbi:MAG: hypothetical protein AABY40_04600 [Nanoarchaeota archaeon]
MTTKNLTVETQLDRFSNRGRLLNHTNMVVRLDENTIFYASKDEGPDFEPYSSVLWNVDTKNSKEDYLLRLAGLYEEVSKGNFHGRPNCRSFVHLTYGGLEEAPVFVSEEESKNFQDNVPLEQLLGDVPEILSHPHFKDFVTLSVSTPYMLLGMYDFTGSWKPESGFLEVVSHNNLAAPLARLISETARTKVSPDELETVLANNVYNFKTF